MQTLLLPCGTFRDLRAISSGQSPSRWQTPSMRGASKWETASPLPNPLGPTLAVGSRPVTSRQRPDRCPTLGAGLTMASPFREAWIGANAHCDGPAGAGPRRVCPRQTAHDPVSRPAPKKAGEGMPDHGQARASELRCTPSPGLSFPLRPQRSGARACGKKTADPETNVVALAGLSSGARRQCERALRQRLSSGGG